MFEHDSVIYEYEHEKSRPREAEALQTLRKVASLVKPIMRQRGWNVGILTEFWPPEKNLLGLNWNKGQKICLRLRYPTDEKQFLPLEDVVDTMLHELCHIVYGPHDEPFHTLWNQLREEHELLLRKGYTGEGFLSTGHKLGGGHIPRHEARRRARAAAEKRQTLNAGSGQKLGGTRVQRGQDIRQVIADAATRRAAVTKGCASGTERARGIVEEMARNGFRTKAEEEDANEEAIMLAYIDLVQEDEKEKYGDNYVPPSNQNPAGSQGVASSKPTASTSRNAPPISESPKPMDAIRSASRQNSLSPPPPSTTTIVAVPSSFDPWTCDICTLVNPSTYLVCDACSTERPSPPPSPKIRPQNPSSKRPPEIPRPSISSTTSTTGKGKKSIKSLVALDKATEKKPLGWLCHRCGTWMESEWWTCAGCEGMKLAS